MQRENLVASAFLLAVFAFFVLVLLNFVPAQAAEPALPQTFTAVDTRPVLGSPDPLPLEPERAFPALQFERPVELTHAGDGSGRLFVVEQRGVIRVFENNDDVQKSQVFLDIRASVLRAHNEEGLLGLAFHPRYEENGELFVYYSAPPRVSIISRFKVSADSPNRVDRDSEEILLKIDQPYGNHNGGSIKFGPDGYLYIGLGDGGLRNDPHYNAQHVSTLLGSILRIDVDKQDPGLNYAVPPDNPFVDLPGARGEIWAYGFRNPWRLSFDNETGNLYTGDVGQDRYEEIDLVRRGGNYGWNKREGFHEFERNGPDKHPQWLEPLVEYFRHEGVSVTGGLVYRGDQLKDFNGAYFYADYVSGNIWMLRHAGDEVREHRQVARTNLQIAAFGEDEDHQMYLCVFDGIYRLRPREFDVQQVAARFPRKLSETGLFASVPDNVPAKGLIPYELNMPFWSDFAVKDRYIALPKKGSVKFDPIKKWEFPEGTVFVKTFWMHRNRMDFTDPFRLETRLLVNSPDGWVGYTYVYDQQQQEAYLLDGAQVQPLEIQTADGPITQHYYFPSRSECLACHTKAEGFVLGLTTRQMNRELAYHGDTKQQLRWLSELGVFEERPADPPDEQERYPDWRFGNFERSPGVELNTHALPDGDSEVLARAWLEVNCAMCHRPEGIAPRQRDLRFHTPLAKMNLVNEQPGHGQMTPPDGRMIKPGQPLLSELVVRSGHRGARQMPPLATNLVSPRGLAILRKWIAQMDESTTD